MEFKHHLSTPPKSQQFSESTSASIFPITPPLSGEKPCDKFMLRPRTAAPSTTATSSSASCTSSTSFSSSNGAITSISNTVINIKPKLTTTLTVSSCTNSFTICRDGSTSTSPTAIFARDTPSANSCITVPVIAAAGYNTTRITGTSLCTNSTGNSSNARVASIKPFAKSGGDSSTGSCDLDILSQIPTVTIVNGDTTNQAKIISVRLIDNKVIDVQTPLTKYRNTDDSSTPGAVNLQLVKHLPQIALHESKAVTESDVNDSSDDPSSRYRIGRPKKADIPSLQQEGAQSESYLKCLVCKRVFPRIKSLEAHMRIHTGRYKIGLSWPTTHDSKSYQVHIPPAATSCPM